MNYLWTAFFSILPISELRGGIPFAMARGIPWYIAWPYAAAVNALAAPLCWLFLSTAHGFFYGPRPSGGPERGSGKTAPEGPGGFRWYRRLFDGFVERARRKLHRGVKRWGALGIALFVAVPLPITGAWTGTLGAWVLGLPRQKTLSAVIAGVAAAGAIVTAVMLLGAGALRLFIKEL
jgi:uncharacterized membrane protein